MRAKVKRVHILVPFLCISVHQRNPFSSDLESGQKQQSNIRQVTTANISIGQKTWDSISFKHRDNIAVPSSVFLCSFEPKSFIKQLQCHFKNIKHSTAVCWQWPYVTKQNVTLTGPEGNCDATFKDACVQVFTLFIVSSSVTSYTTHTTLACVWLGKRTCGKTSVQKTHNPHT